MTTYPLIFTVALLLRAAGAELVVDLSGQQPAQAGR